MKSPETDSERVVIQAENHGGAILLRGPRNLTALCTSSAQFRREFDRMCEQLNPMTATTWRRVARRGRTLRWEKTLWLEPRSLSTLRDLYIKPQESQCVLDVDFVGGPGQRR